MEIDHFNRSATGQETSQANRQMFADKQSYVSGGEEVHGLSNLEGEAKEVVGSQKRRFTKEEHRPLLVWKRTAGQAVAADGRTDGWTDGPAELTCWCVWSLVNRRFDVGVA